MPFRATASDRIDRIIAALRRLNAEERAAFLTALEPLLATWPNADYFLLPKFLSAVNTEFWALQRKTIAGLFKQLSLHAKRIKDRNRKPDPETVKQDAEIHRLRTADPKRWSWKKLGNRFGMTEAGARQASKRHDRRLKRTN
jgi:hypothetical protein